MAESAAKCPLYPGAFPALDSRHEHNRPPPPTPARPRASAGIAQRRPPGRVGVLVLLPAIAKGEEGGNSSKESCLVASPTRTDTHADPDNLIQCLLGTYAALRMGCKASANGTVKLGPDDIVQPDSSLRRLPEAGGRARVDAEGYLLAHPNWRWKSRPVPSPSTAARKRTAIAARG